jgi:hypothetical protein
MVWLLSFFQNTIKLFCICSNTDSFCRKCWEPRQIASSTPQNTRNLLAALGREQLVVWEGFSDVFRAVGLGVGAIWTLDFLGDRKKNQLFLGWAGVS